MGKVRLFMLLLGCKPPGRHTEQHDVFFGVGTSVKDLVPAIIKFWPEAKGNGHLDAWKEINYVDGHKITVKLRDTDASTKSSKKKLFFVNLGGYREHEFDEFHYKVLSVGEDKAEAIAVAKKTRFYKHTRFPGAESHIDDKYGIDVDDIFEIEDILPSDLKEKYIVEITETEITQDDDLHLGYFKLDKL